MMRVQSRAELEVVKGSKPSAPPAKPQPDAVADSLASLAKAMQDSAAQTQQGMLMLARVVADSKPEPRATALVADVERDEFGKMVRVRISIER